MKKLILLLSIILFVSDAEAEVLYLKQDSLIYEQYILEFEKKAVLPINELITETALYFRDTPYVASTLDNNEKEELVVNLREFDCTTFVESCIALGRTLKSTDHSFSNFCNQLQSVRYRNGVIEDYASRLHYVTDWVYDNSEKGILYDKSPSLGGFLDKKTINFMSAHTDAYKSLQNSQNLQDKVQSIEASINKRGGYHYIKKENIKNVDDEIINGDIIIFATSIVGLDYSHIGIAYNDKGRLTFIHASTKPMKVVVEPQSLYDYCMRSSKCTGITVVRINELN